MHVITFGTDEHMLDANSLQHKRLLEYVDMVDAYTAVIFSSKVNFQIEYIRKLTLITLPKKRFITGLYKTYRYLKQTHTQGKDILISTQDAFEVGVIGYIFAKLLRVPLHVQIHTAIQSPYFTQESLRNKIQFTLSKFIIKRAKAIRVVSDAIKTYLISRQIAEEKIFVSPITGQAPVVVKETLSATTYNILCVARFVECKNLLALIDSFYVFKRAHNHNVTLTIVGGGELHSAMKEKMHTLGLTDHDVVLLNWAKDLDQLYIKSDIYIQPSLYEGFGSAIIEALTRGVPVVVTPGVGAINYVKIGVNGFVTAGYTADDLYRGLEFAYANLGSIDPAEVRASITIPTDEERRGMLMQSWKKALV